MKLALHWKILIGMLLGAVIGYLLVSFGYTQFIKDWIAPFGSIFLKLLKMIAIPLIVASLIKGISDLDDIAKFSKIGIRTIVTYILTTLVAISIGLAVVFTINPGNNISQETLTEILSENSSKAGSKLDMAKSQNTKGPLQPLMDLVPDNIFNAASNNGLMLQVIFFVVFFGICVLLIKKEEAVPLKKLFHSLNEVILKMVDIIMLYAPIGVFALIANLIAETTRPDLFWALLSYAGSVILGLFLMLCFYLFIVYFFTGKSPLFFLKGISPAQLVAFSTSSSAATLPITMERVEEHLGVEEEITSFVCPVGATINMDGTSLYQAVAAVFICNVVGEALSFGAIITILLTALLASIGSAAVPGAGVVMLIIVLESIDFPPESLALGIALILAVDRPLDMCRTAINVTGDAAVSMLVAKANGNLKSPSPKNIGDNYKR